MVPYKWVRVEDILINLDGLQIVKGRDNCNTSEILLYYTGMSSPRIIYVKDYPKALQVLIQGLFN